MSLTCINVTANLQLPMKKWTLEDDSDEEEDKQDNKENKDEIVEEEVDPLDAFMQVTYVLVYYIKVLLFPIMLTLISVTDTLRTSYYKWHQDNKILIWDSFGLIFANYLHIFYPNVLIFFFYDEHIWMYQGTHHCVPLVVFHTLFVYVNNPSLLDFITCY